MVGVLWHKGQVTDIARYEDVGWISESLCGNAGMGHMKMCSGLHNIVLNLEYNPLIKSHHTEIDMLRYIKLGIEQNDCKVIV